MSPVVSPSEPFEEIGDPSSQDEIASSSLAASPRNDVGKEEEGIYSEPGDYTNSGTFDNDGNLIIEERVPTKWDSSTDSGQESDTVSVENTLPIIDESSEPTVYEESTALKIGEALNGAVTGTANFVTNLFGANESEPDGSESKEGDAEGELIEVIEEPI